MNHSQPAVSLDRLARRYGRELVLTDISLTVSAGRTVVLYGANGAGKTTLLKVLSTRLRPSRGSGRVFGFDLVRQGHQVRRRTAMLSVFGGVYPALSALENLRLAARLYGRNRSDQQLESDLRAVGLAEVGEKSVRSFSSGMKKRLGLARLLQADARLWLLDEPYAALDDQGKALVDNMLASARSDGVTVLLASHELHRASRFADAVLHVAGGGIESMESGRDDAGTDTSGRLPTRSGAAGAGDV